MDIGRLVNAADIAADVLRAQTERIALLETDLLTAQDQIGGLTSELGQMRGRYEAEWKALADAQREIKDLRQQLAEQRRATDCICEAKSMLDEQYKHQERQFTESQSREDYLLKRLEGFKQQLAASQAEAAALTQLVNGFTRREDALRATLTDDDILVYLADVELPRPAAEHIAEFSVMVFREGMAHAANAMQAEAAALRTALEGCAAWLESRPDYTEGDAATSSRARGILATPFAAAERVRLLEEVAKAARKWLVGPSKDVTFQESWESWNATVDGLVDALAVLDAATAKETATVEEVKGDG